MKRWILLCCVLLVVALCGCRKSKPVVQIDAAAGLVRAAITAIAKARGAE